MKISILLKITLILLAILLVFCIVFRAKVIHSPELDTISTFA